MSDPRRHPAVRATPIVAFLATCSIGICSPFASAAAGGQAEPLHPRSAAARAATPSEINDRVLPKRPHRMARASSAAVSARGRGGNYTVTVNGKTTTVRIFMSEAFTALDTVADRDEIASINRGWAEEFARMPHGREISSLTVYLSPYSEISSDSVCGSEADSCYDPNDGTMYLVGETPPDGAGILQIAMHEYGHHVAANRLNTPWDSLGWGPKHWASAQRVCSWVRRGLMWPFDQGTHYGDNPGEVWAETYRIVAAKASNLAPDPWEILNPRWNPGSNATLLAAAARDVTSPWRGRVRSTWSGRLDSRGRQAATVRIPSNLDGTLDTRLWTTGGLRAKLRLTPVGGSLRDGKVCGASSVTATVTRTAGRGSWGLAARYPRG